MKCSYVEFLVLHTSNGTEGSKNDNNTPDCLHENSDDVINSCINLKRVYMKIASEIILHIMVAR